MYLFLFQPQTGDGYDSRHIAVYTRQLQIEYLP